MHGLQSGLSPPVGRPPRRSLTLIEDVSHLDCRAAFRRFLLHVLPKGFHRIRYYGLLASSRTKAETIERARKLIELATPAQPLRSAKSDPAPAEAEATDKPIHPCPCCGSAMIIIEMFEAGSTPRNKPTTPVARRIDTS